MTHRIAAPPTSRPSNPLPLHLRVLSRALFLALGALLAACSGASGPQSAGPGGGGPGGGGPGDGDGSDPIDDTGAPAVAVDPGPIVARLELEQPAEDRFLLRGTVPLPTGTWREEPIVPLAVVDWDGTPVASQVEVTSRYPSDDFGVDVVEVLARVRRNPAIATGERVHYDVMLAEHEAPQPTASDVDALAEGPHHLDPAVAALLDDPLSIAIRSRDALGREYVHHPLAAEHAHVRKYGRALTEVTTYGVQEPEAFVTGPKATLPHLLGVHAYLRSISGEPLLGLDLRLHNGFDGRDKHDSSDDALGKVYFDSVELLVPEGWTVLADFDDPFLGVPYAEGQRTVVPLVKPLDDGKLHVAPFQAQFHRRLAIARDSSGGQGRKRARALLNGEGRAFAVRGVSPDTGEDLWSWWRPTTARYFPQSLLVPDLEHIGGDSLRKLMQERLADLAKHVAKGTAKGSYPLQEGVLGWAHPWGVAYGGMTGGDEIVAVDGIETLCGASVAGYRYTELVHRMQTSRQPAALFRANGRPTSVETWWKDGGPFGGYVPFFFYLIENGSNDPFGLKKAPEHLVEHVGDQDLAPDYEARLFDFEPHDLQHFVRYTRSPKVLAWLGNDKLAIDDLTMMAEAFHLSFHTGGNAPGDLLQDSGLQALIERVNLDPGVGSSLGRGEGWGLDCAAAAYRTGEPAWRAAKKPWLSTVVDTAALAQSQCTGFFQSIVNSHGLGGKYRVRQHIEHVIFENALRGIVQSVVRNADPVRDQLAKQVLAFSYWSSVHEMAWSPGAGAPWSWTAVAPLGEFDEPWCQPVELPGDWHTDTQEKYQLYNSLAAAYWTSGEPLFLERAAEVLGVSDLLQGLLDGGLNNIGNRAALIAIVQRAEGLL